MPDQDRFEKTVAKINRGALPTVQPGPLEIVLGDDSPCDGCGEPMRSNEQLYRVTIEGTIFLRLRDICYSAWLMYRPS